MGPLSAGPYTPLCEPDEDFPLVLERSHLFMHKRYALVGIDRNWEGDVITGRPWSMTERNSLPPAPILSFNFR